MKEVKKLFLSFFWNSKGDKIKRHIIINDYSHGRGGGGGRSKRWILCREGGSRK